jgi:hypothetical protein
MFCWSHYSLAHRAHTDTDSREKISAGGADFVFITHTHVYRLYARSGVGLSWRLLLIIH